MEGKPAQTRPQGSMNRIERVAIVGGGGQIGRHILEQLLETGNFSITAIQRPSSTSKLPDSVNVVRVDYDDDTALVSALTGHQALIITMAVTAPWDTTSKLVRAAARAGIAYVLPNWYGHDAGNEALCRDSLLLERRDAICTEIQQLGVSAYLLVVCGFWYEFSLGGGPTRYGFDIARRRLTWFDEGDVPITTTTWPQCGRAVARLLSLKMRPDGSGPALAQFANGPVYVSSFRLSQADMFASVKRVTGTTDGQWTVTRESAEQRWKDGKAAVERDGDWSQFTKMLYSRMFVPDMDDTSYQAPPGDRDNEVLGLPVEDLDTYTAIAVRMGENEEVAYSH